MPIYEYRCSNGHTFEELQSINDEPVQGCQECGAPVERVLHPVAVHFKGSGFYSTDYGSKKGKAAQKEKGAAEGGSTDGTGKSDSTAAEKSSSGDTKKGDSKSTDATAG